MKRYLLFSGDVYYPAGGWDDLVDTFDTEKEAHEFGRELYKRNNNWFHIVDLELGRRTDG